MKKSKFTTFIWIPRVLGIFFALLLLILSFDSFEGDKSIWLKLGGFFIHNIPSILLLLMIILLWTRPFLTGIIFICLVILFTGMFRTFERFDSFMLISFPVFIPGLLFIWASFQKKVKLDAGSDSTSSS